MAIAAGALTTRVRSAPPDEAFTCGLLADIGTLAIATIYPVEFADLLGAPQPLRAGARAALERERFATDHNEMGAALLEDWHLPRVFVAAVFHHETPARAQLPEGSREFTVCALLGLAAQFADFCVAREDDRRGQVPDLILSAAKLGIDEAALAKLSDEVVAQWTDWGKILEVKTQEVPPFDQVAQEVPTAAIPLPATPVVGEKIEPLSILAVDDDRAVLLVIEHLLRGLGHHVATAQDGKTALARAISLRPQIIISDWIMPGMDGISLCRALRDTEEGRQMYFIVLSALEQDDQLVEAFESGVDDYLTKPFTPRVLSARLRAGLRVIRLQEEARRDNENMRRFAAELAVANRRLQQAALTDPLTGLPNRRYAMDRLEQEWSASSRSHRPLACLMVDFDRFKAINDTHGHDMGDLVLRQTASLLRKEARTEDVICRMGGEEFLVIAPDTTLGAAVHLAERLRSAIAHTRFSSGTAHCGGTISVGVAQRDAAMLRLDELIKAADNALYHAKSEGRDRVAAHDRVPLARAAGG
jgi:diguanylate cyclase (GGDEF)-like protein